MTSSEIILKNFGKLKEKMVDLYRSVLNCSGEIQYTLYVFTILNIQKCYEYSFHECRNAAATAPGSPSSPSHCCWRASTAQILNQNLWFSRMRAPGMRFVKCLRSSLWIVNKWVETEGPSFPVGAAAPELNLPRTWWPLNW